MVDNIFEMLDFANPCTNLLFSIPFLKVEYNKKSKANTLTHAHELTLQFIGIRTYYVYSLKPAPYNI